MQKNRVFKLFEIYQIMTHNSEFERYLEKTLQLTKELTLHQIDKQWQKIKNYEYRINKLRQFIDIGFVTILIIGTPLVAYREIKTIIDSTNEVIAERLPSRASEIEKKVEE